MSLVQPTIKNDATLLRRRRWRLFALLFVLMWVTLSAISISWNFNDRAAESNEIKRQEMQALAIYLHSLADSLDHVFSDLRWLPQQNELQNWLADHSPRDLDSIAHEYEALLSSKPIYDHIRFIDEQGQEIIRVNFEDGQAQRVPQEQLKDVSRSYFVQEAQRLSPGEVYLSQLDLKVQENKIVTPYKPLLRFIAPATDPQGRHRGIVMLGYDAREMFEDLHKAADNYPGELNVLNASGYWLMAPHSSQEWGYLIPERAEANIAVSYPKLWQMMEEKDSGQFETEDGIFTFISVTPRAYWSRSPGASIEPSMSDAKIINGTDHWILMTRISPSVISTMLSHYNLRILSFLLANTLLSGLLATLLSQAWLKRHMHRIELEEMAFFDRLTGLANRVNLTYQLENQIRIALRHNHNLALFLIDLDGFKQINDTLGHDGGDQALIEAARRFKNSIRQSDSVGRIGGDEFMVLLPHVEHTDDAIRVASKILEQLKPPLMIKGKKCQLGASIGIAMCPQDSDDPETLWHLADMAMYRSKNTGKNRFCFYSCHDGYDLVCKTQGQGLR